MTTTKTLADFEKIVNAEDYFQFFELEYDRRFVNVNRLHILKQFSLSIEEIESSFPDLNEGEKLNKYREALAAAYQVFESKSPLETKLFKVFHENRQNVVLLEDIEEEEEEQ
ncbi:MAG: nitrogenase-stabilizing/protective protein NifW [Prochloraceae cyanobacterium]